MAAGSFGMFESTFHLKRKRFEDDNDDHSNQHDFSSFKRRNIAQLPIRSPARPSITVTPAFGQFPLHPGTLTPDSIPEDDVFRSSAEPDKTTMAIRPQISSHTSSTDSLAVQPDSDSVSNDDTEMDLSSPKQASKQIPTPSRIGRARSNDLMSPVRSPIVMPPSPSRWTHNRIPTPVASHFPANSPFESSFASAAARQMRPHSLQTSLSPMVDAESWTPQIQRPPSPGPENDLEPAFDGDAMMDMEDSNMSSHMMSSSFSELSVRSSDQQAQPELPSRHCNQLSSPIRDRTSQTSWALQHAQGQPHQGLGLNSPGEGQEINTTHEEQMTAMQHGNGHGHTRHQSSTGRTARLHMGFRADCEKCIARVPGHYSHILWS